MPRLIPSLKSTAQMPSSSSLNHMAAQSRALGERPMPDNRHVSHISSMYKSGAVRTKNQRAITSSLAPVFGSSHRAITSSWAPLPDSNQAAIPSASYSKTNQTAIPSDRNKSTSAAALPSNAAFVVSPEPATQQTPPVPPPQPTRAVQPKTTPPSAPPLAYELIQGPLCRWSTTDATSAYSAPPTAIFLHGILGSRKNWRSFARRLVRDFPAWQMLLVDLRCHGDSSSSVPGRHPPPHTVESAGRDVLQLTRHLKLVPRVLVGHSFGGKVALSMVDQAAKPLAKPVQVWVLDATPGNVHAGGDGEDHPLDLIKALAAMNGPITDRKAVVSALCSQGFSQPVSQWMTTNLRPSTTSTIPNGTPNGSPSNAQVAAGDTLEWAFDLEGIAQMYESYEATNMWPLVETVPEGVRIEFLRAERSLHRWAHGDVQRISSAELRASAEGAGVRMHVLEDSGHWVHADNPEGLFRILSPSFH